MSTKPTSPSAPTRSFTGIAPDSTPPAPTPAQANPSPPQAQGVRIGQGKRPRKATGAAVSIADQTMMPLSLRLTRPQLDGLNLLRQRTGLRQNELVRRAIDAYLKTELA